MCVGRMFLDLVLFDDKHVSVPLIRPQQPWKRQTNMLELDSYQSIFVSLFVISSQYSMARLVLESRTDLASNSLVKFWESWD